MRAAIVIYCLFLVIEAGLALAISGNPFLAVAVTCGVLFYAAVWKTGGPWGEIVRALTAGLITVAGPLYYHGALMPTVLCFIALPHVLATTQCFWEMALSKDPAQQNVRMRTLVFSVAFYAAMGLVFVLLRGDPEVISPAITTTLAVVVLLAALPAWDLARVTRLKPGRARKATPSGVLARRIILASMVLGMIAALFMGVLPAAAEKLCAISPRWKPNVEAPGKPAPRPPQPPPPPGSEATRPGLDSSAMTGRHELPRKSDIQSTGIEQLFVRLKDKAVARRMAASPVYVRTHTFDAWKDGVWQSAVSGGQWFTDAGDGSEDGFTTVKKPAGPGIEHTVFMANADGSILPALQGVCAYRLPGVFGIPGDLYQMQAAGSIRYDAVSTPSIWDDLQEANPGRAGAQPAGSSPGAAGGVAAGAVFGSIGGPAGPFIGAAIGAIAGGNTGLSRNSLRAGNTGNDAHTKLPPAGDAITSFVYGDPLLRPDAGASLDQRITRVRKWFRDNIRYSTRVEGRAELTPLDNFLMAERKGYCDFYASAACLLLRFSGIPTRIAFGYAGNEYDPDQNLFVFTDDNAHAWTEIYVDGFGWTVCDFTPVANIGHLNNRSSPPRPAFNEKSYEETEPKNPAKDDQKKPDEFSLTAWWDDLVKRILEMEPWELVKEVLKWLAIAAVPALLLWWLLKRKKAAAAAKESFAEDERQPAYFAEFLRIFREAGFPRPPGNTPREYYSTLFDRGVAGEEFSPMIFYHYRSRYTDAAPDREEEASWLTLVRETERRLKQSRPPA